jgi:hypothetical protein
VPITDKTCQKEFDEWQAREKRWRDNRRAFANYASYKKVRVRRVKRPDPPQWIERHCEPELAQDAIVRLSLVCQAYDDYLRYDWSQHIEGPQAAITFSQRVPLASSGDHNPFVEYLLKNLHYDGPWTNSETGARVYGLGTHLTLAHAGRVYLWGPPGMLLLRRPEGKVEVRMTWGVDIHVVDIPIRGYKLPVYFSIAKVFNQEERKAIENHANAGMDMAGISVTIKR